MLFRDKNKPRERFYLLPGQGGRNYYRKQRFLLLWSVVVSLFVGGAMAGMMWWLARSHP